MTTSDKLKLAERAEVVLPEGVDPAQCRFSHSRPVWRLENGRAGLVAYPIYRGPRNQLGKIPGALGRSELRWEILVAIAYQGFLVGLSFDKVRLLMNFFQNLRQRKSQVDALLHPRARHGESEFDPLCALLAHSAVVHADETGWSLHSVWAFLSENVRGLFFGVPKDADTLQQILDPATFAGLVISRRRGGGCELHAGADVLGAPAAEGDQTDAARPGPDAQAEASRPGDVDLGRPASAAGRLTFRHAFPGRNSLPPPPGKRCDAFSGPVIPARRMDSYSDKA